MLSEDLASSAGGYRNVEWLVQELDVLDRSKAHFGVGFITWSMAKQPGFLDLALERKLVAIMFSFGKTRKILPPSLRAWAPQPA